VQIPGSMAPSRRQKLALLTALYFVEGMPWGFQSRALPVFLRTHDTSLTLIGLLNVLSLPWMIKVLWAPLIDRYWSPRIGKRKSWILPMQLGLALSALAGATVADDGDVGKLLVLVALMNLFSATMDIAVDGLAVDLLDKRELGPGNVTQVVGYKLGTLATGGLLVWATGSIGWGGLFAVMGGLTMLVMAATALFREPWTEATLPTAPHEKLRAIVQRLFATLNRPGMRLLVVVIATYKVGEQLVESMFKPFLIDEGFSATEVGLWVGTYGIVGSIVGSTLGGVLASKLPLLRAVTIAAVFRVVPVLAVFLMTFHRPTPAEIIFIAVTESFFGGLLTTTMFAYMMSRTDRRIGATHFTLLSTVEMLGKVPVPMLAGPIADHWGYSVLFGLGTACALAFLAVLPPLRRADAQRPLVEQASEPPPP
jgi:PAT family beta-lactamase induction signal transducer AmpG